MTEQAMATELAVKDVLIVGGGIGGLSAAIALTKRGAHVVVVERALSALGTNIGINYRPVYALQELGILDEAIRRGQSYDAEQAARFEDLFDAQGRLLSVGSTADLPDDWELPVSSVRFYRPELTDIMQNAARERGAELLIGHSYRWIEPRDDGVEVRLTTGERHTYDLVVGADGTHSELRDRFFPEVDPPTYLGGVSCRVVIENAPEHWRGGQHLAPDGSRQRLITAKYPGNRFYVAAGRRMPQRHVDQDEAREIVREKLRPWLGSDMMFDEIYARITDDQPVVVSAGHWIFVEPPWHRGRIVLIGDAVHATAPTIGAAGGQALEDGVVLAQELTKHSDVEEALTAFADRRKDRTKLVVETSRALVESHEQQRSPGEEMAMRTNANRVLASAY